LENLDDEVDTNTAWETIRENIKTSVLKELLSTEAANSMVCGRMFKTVTPKETS
jgi:hypothetical protein